MNLIRFTIRLALSASGIPESILCAYFIAELAGYWLNALLPTDKLPFLSRRRVLVEK